MYGAGEILVGHQKGRVAARAIAVIACLPVIAGTCIALKGAASHQASIAASSLLSLRLRPIDLLTIITTVCRLAVGDGLNKCPRLPLGGKRKR